jgi:MoaA/NifB/PqqE/SkfB family radical SAM enzyme
MQPLGILPATYPPPRLIFWETTAGCNLACIHCRRMTVAA